LAGGDVNRGVGGFFTNHAAGGFNRFWIFKKNTKECTS
jgi:hypothetical protein